jgi:undecaprenyl diphosphate synthase
LSSDNPAHPDLHGLDPTRLPAHVAIIMDGNGRWAQKRFLSRIKGHEKGSEAVRTAVRTCREIGIPHLTLYAFSTENWQRPKVEVEALMVLLKKFLRQERRDMMDKDIRLFTIGQTDRLPADVKEALLETIAATKDNASLQLTIALSYGSRNEICQASRRIAAEVEKGRLTAAEIDDRLFSKYLMTAGMPDPDLLIRTSGEMRISNFLLWQIAYAEIYVTPTLWPDFGAGEFIRILKDYQGRERRYGQVT